MTRFSIVGAWFLALLPLSWEHVVVVEGSVVTPNPSSTTATTTTSQVVSPPEDSVDGARRHPEPDASIDWDSLNFSLNNIQTDAMWLDRIAVAGPEEEKESLSYSSTTSRCLVPCTSIPLHPAATVLNYGQGLFEGLKAFRRADGKSIALFRPDRNARRMSAGAQRFLLPPVPVDTFVQAAASVVKANARLVPPFGRGALYLRPLLLGTGADLGVKPSSEATFCIYASPVGNYFKGGGLGRPIRLQAVRGTCRAVPGGAGSVKAAGNYAPPFWVQKQVKNRGFDEALFLDAKHNEAIEEAGASNFFAVFPNNTVVTPPLTEGTILAGVTRESIIELARAECGCEVYERRLTLEDLKGASEAFCCGTGASVTSVGCVSICNDKEEEEEIISFDDEAGPLTRQLYNMLREIQMGGDATTTPTQGQVSGESPLAAKYRHWIHIVEP